MVRNSAGQCIACDRSVIEIHDAFGQRREQLLAQRVVKGLEILEAGGFLAQVDRLIVVIGAAALIEMIYHIQLNAAMGPNLNFFGVTLDTSGMASWLGAAAILVIGLGALEVARRRFVRVWGQAQEEIEAEIKRREAA